MERKIHYLFIVLFTLINTFSFAQDSTRVNQTLISGRVITDQGNPLPGAYIFINDFQHGTISDSSGYYQKSVTPNKEFKLIIVYIGYDTAYATQKLKPGEKVTLNFQLNFNTRKMKAHIVKGNRMKETGLNPISTDATLQIAGPNANIEKTLIFQGQGVSSRNELSSQYSVRGGNFDENLIYVNGVQIYRPFLVRSGRQEGLSFVNPSLVDNVNFSSGGFESRYGDKMSSVLDVTYKEPEKFSGFVEGSFLGAQIALEQASDDRKFTQIHGFRYRTNQYLLKGLDTQGAYQPNFIDYQGYFTYDITDRVEIGFLGSFSRNKYLFVPETRKTEFGTFQEALQLTVFYDGQEIDQYQTALGAFTVTALPTDSLLLKFSASVNNSNETETFDIEGAYRLDELDKDLGSSNFGQVAFNRGIGGFINHARNYYKGTIASLTHDGKFYGHKHEISWGIRGSMEWVDDQYQEWEYLDSSGYSTPQVPSDQIILNQSYASKNNLNWYRLNGYAQWERTFEMDSNLIHINVGGRLNYWSYNNQLVGGPRVLASYKPNWKKHYRFKVAWGMYHQPPSYREMRNIEGFINPNIKAQTSIHYVLGAEHEFEMWERPFKISAEMYYKDLRNIIPYELNNVRIRYYATNNSNGYAAGIDFKINGEFVKGVESWASLSFMKTEENLTDDFYYKYYNANGEQVNPGDPFNPVARTERIEPGFIPRPTDQRINFAIFFQDYLPNNPTFKTNITIYLATGLPFGPPSFERYNDVFRMPPYRRVDLGFSKELLQNKQLKRNKLGNSKGFKSLKSMWLALEIFNLLGVQNTISYSWVHDISNRYYAVPNYLTPRQVNLKLQFKF
ncbi:TonB-dependent receptor [bacterium SCSIO 12643]|nr:TonB-dependent receptor [bacterium SCSIO 12643]